MIRSLSALRPSAAMVTAVVALVFACAGSATAASLITGKQIQNNSVTGADIKNRSLGAGDLTAKARQSLRAAGGTRGPAGPAGPKGDAGPAGSQGADGAAGAPGVSGLEVVTETSGANTALKSITATCPAGKRVIGTGGQSTVLGAAVLLRVVPNDDLTGVTVAADNAEGNVFPWGVRAYAICANVG